MFEKTKAINRAYKDILYGLLIFSFVLASFVVLFRRVNSAQAAAASHIVISEVQVAGATADDEFIELYNPTASEVDLTGYRLTRKTSGGTESNLVASLSGAIPAHGYYLVTQPTDYDGAVAADETYSATTNALTNNNTVLLYSDAGLTLVDKVGMGTAADAEGTPFAVSPDPDMSLERKADTDSTGDTMASGGNDETLGNAEDTDNNDNDFVVRVSPEPQNSSSSTEELTTPTETETPTQEPTESPTPTEEPSVTPTTEPSETPTPTVEPTESPSPTPSEEPTPTESPTETPTPTVEPTATPTEEPPVSPSPTEEPTPTEEPEITPTEAPSPTPTPDDEDDHVGRVLGFRVGRSICTMQYKYVRRGWFTFLIPDISCERTDTPFPFFPHHRR